MRCHLLSYKHVDLPAVIFVEGQAFVDLRPRKVGKTAVADHAVHGFTVLQQRDDVVNANTRAFDSGMATANPGGTNDVAIGRRDGVHG